MVNQFLDKATVDIGSGIIFCGNYVACFGLGMWKKSAVLEVRGQSCYIIYIYIIYIYAYACDYTVLVYKSAFWIARHNNLGLEVLVWQ